MHAVWTHADVAHLPPIPFRLTGLTSLEPYRQPVLAKDVVRYVGEPVAAVFAQDQYVAEDAADLIEVVDRTIDRQRCAPSNSRACTTHERTTEAAVMRKSYGDVDAAFRAAHAVVALELSVGRHSGVPLETRGAIARYDETRDILEMHGAAKVPHWNRDAIARMLGRKAETRAALRRPCRRRIRHPRRALPGGRAGLRGCLEIPPPGEMDRGPARAPDRRQSLAPAASSCPRRRSIAHGHILAIEDEFFHDHGAYMRTHAATVPDLAAAMLPGPYRVPAYRAVGHIRLTNKTPCGTYRAPGRYECTFVRERLLDAIAARVGVDTVEMRRRNLIAKSAMPFDLRLDTLGTRSSRLRRLRAAARQGAARCRLGRAADATAPAPRAAARRSARALRMFVEKSGLGPLDGVRIAGRAGGAVEVVTGAASVGQGIETVMAQICADALGVDYRACPGGPRPDRPDRARHGRFCVARDRDDRRGHAAAAAEAARRRRSRLPPS